MLLWPLLSFLNLSWTYVALTSAIVLERKHVDGAQHSFENYYSTTNGNNCELLRPCPPIDLPNRVRKINEAMTITHQKRKRWVTWRTGTSDDDTVGHHSRKPFSCLDGIQTYSRASEIIFKPFPKNILKNYFQTISKSYPKKYFQTIFKNYFPKNIFILFPKTFSKNPFQKNMSSFVSLFFYIILFHYRSSSCFVRYSTRKYIGNMMLGDETQTPLIKSSASYFPFLDVY